MSNQIKQKLNWKATSVSLHDEIDFTRHIGDPYDCFNQIFNELEWEQKVKELSSCPHTPRIRYIGCDGHPALFLLECNDKLQRTMCYDCIVKKYPKLAKKIDKWNN